MTNLRTAAQQALEALEVATNCLDGYYIPRGKTTLPEIEDAITALKAALAEPVQEPVALNDGRLWQYPDGSIGIGSAPPQCKPLTEEEIKQLLFESAGMTVTFSAVDLSLARAIEAKHGIGSSDVGT